MDECVDGWKKDGWIYVFVCVCMYVCMCVLGVGESVDRCLITRTEEVEVWPDRQVERI